MVIRPGLFHSIKAVSKKGVYALEFETPYKKNDLIRFKDNYGRQAKHYEGKKFTKKLSDTDFIKFKKPKLGRKNIYSFNNLEILLEVRKNLKNLVKKNISYLPRIPGDLRSDNDIRGISSTRKFG